MRYYNLSSADHNRFKSKLSLSNVCVVFLLSNKCGFLAEILFNASSIQSSERSSREQFSLNEGNRLDRAAKLSSRAVLYESWLAAHFENSPVITVISGTAKSTFSGFHVLK